MAKQRHPSFDPIVSPFEIKRPVVWDNVFGRKAPLEVEIGFGFGEFLLKQAVNNPEINYIGIEQIWERVYKTLQRFESHQKNRSAAQIIPNVKILFNDARDVFERLIFPGSVDRIYCLFPCPWPKNSHEKHRLFNEKFLRLLNNRLKSEGELTIVTDWEPFNDWILGQKDNTGFKVKTDMINPRFDTKFERKWMSQGQKEFFEIHMVKERHLEAVLWEDEELKTYRLNDFLPEKFHLQDDKGEISVILKDKVYDPKKKLMLVLVIVAEGHLTQYFWASIKKSDDVWKVGKAQGQQFFPTPGIIRALENIYQAALATIQS